MTELDIEEIARNEAKKNITRERKGYDDIMISEYVLFSVLWSETSTKKGGLLE